MRPAVYALARFTFLALTLSFVFAGSFPERAGAQVGWCQPQGVVARRGFGFVSGPLTGFITSSWNWHAGGVPSAQQCIDDTMLSIKWCGSYCQGAFNTAPDICASNPLIWSVDNRLDSIYYNINGQAAYQSTGQALVASNQVNVSYCCYDFGMNCTSALP